MGRRGTLSFLGGPAVSHGPFTPVVVLGWLCYCCLCLPQDCAARNMESVVLLSLLYVSCCCCCCFTEAIFRFFLSVDSFLGHPQIPLGITASFGKHGAVKKGNCGAQGYLKGAVSDQGVGLWSRYTPSDSRKRADHTTTPSQRNPLYFSQPTAYLHSRRSHSHPQMA